MLAAATMVIGLFGVVIPVLPGLLLIWAVAVLYGLMVGFGSVGMVAIGLLTAILAVSVVKGFIVPKRAATESGASGWSQIGAVAGGVLGFFTIPIVGLVVGALGGLFATELFLKRDPGLAWSAAVGTAKGFGLSAIIDLMLGMVMIVIWSVWAWTAL